MTKILQYKMKILLLKMMILQVLWGRHSHAWVRFLYTVLKLFLSRLCPENDGFDIEVGDQRPYLAR